MFESGTLADDLVETPFGADFVFQIERFFPGGESWAGRPPLSLTTVARGVVRFYCALVPTGCTKV